MYSFILVCKFELQKKIIKFTKIRTYSQEKKAIQLLLFLLQGMCAIFLSVREGLSEEKFGKRFSVECTRFFFGPMRADK